MPTKPKVTYVEYDLRKKGTVVPTWVTVHWGEDDEMQIYVGKTDPTKLDRKSLVQKAECELHRIAKDLAKTSIELP